MRYDALLLQTCFSAGSNDITGAMAGVFSDMLRLTFPRHSAYARAQRFDYWAIMSDYGPEGQMGGWSKIRLLQKAFEEGYQYVAYIDTDAAVWDMECDLRDALPADKLIGACLHDPAKSAYLRQYQIPPHYNVGVSYYRSDPRTVQFLADWLATHPGHPRWLEQGSFNELVRTKYADVFHACDDRWNATVNVNMVEAPAVLAWHGIMPVMRRFNDMKQAMESDFIRFRV